MDAGVVAPVMAPVAEAAKQAAQAVQAAPQAQVQFIWWLVISSAFTLVFLIELFRALPWSEKAKAGRPIGCDICLTSWGAIALGALSTWQLGLVMTILHVPCIAGLTLFLFALLRRWRGSVLLPPTD